MWYRFHHAISVFVVKAKHFVQRARPATLGFFVSHLVSFHHFYSAVVPKLWYAYHYWYAKAFKVVR